MARKMGQILHLFDVLATPNVIVTSAHDMCGQVRGAPTEQAFCVSGRCNAVPPE